MRRIAWGLSALAGLVLLAGCSGKRAANTAIGGGAPSDKSTVQMVEERIKADSDVAGADIKVAEQGGSITLDGSVKTEAQKGKAEQDVLQVQREKKQQEGVLNGLTLPESGGTAASTTGGK